MKRWSNLFWTNPNTGRGERRNSSSSNGPSKFPRLDSFGSQSSLLSGLLGPFRSPYRIDAQVPNNYESQHSPTVQQQLVPPLSMTQPSNTDKISQNNVNKTSENTKTSNSSRPNSLGIPTSELPARFRCVFPYVSFNHVQSLVYKTVMDSSKPIVVSAPTGSGKTGVFELAIIKMIMDCETRCADLGASKIVYLAPTKALCSERRDDWSKKFSPFDIQCHELTSDVESAINFKNLQRSSILLATPEKWDSVTRSWSGQKAFIQSIRLLLIDEIHLVNDGERGATLEAVISRMKTIRSLIWPTEPDNLRFVAVSATVSNIKDIAEWFSTPTSKAEIYQVDPKERPVKLRTVVLGYSTNANMNEFSFDHLLNHKLPDVVKDYAEEKPALIFCATRKSAVSAASTLAKEGKLDMSYSTERRNYHLQLSRQMHDKTLQELTRFGIAFHHAGLNTSDRRTIEAAFIDGRIMILCCTSTLALGVNLPAHLVIIKNTLFYDSGEHRPYTESTLVQMIGRAGRPQFDTDATAVIMTKASCRDSIEKMLTGKLIVDSQLHKYLTEHMNSEIVLNTITNDNVARKWIDSTFLHVRLMKSPENYGLSKNSSKTVKEDTIIQLCKGSVALLLQHKMVKRGKQGQLEATEAGRAMARHYVSLNTMVKLLQLTGTETLLDLLSIVCSSQEVASDIQVRAEDKSGLNKLLDSGLRFPIGDKIQTREKKATVLMQAVFGNLTIPESHLFLESLRVAKNADRVVSCLRDVALINTNISYKLLLNVITLSQCFAARLWEDSIYVAKQLEKIGNTLSHNLASSGLTSFELIRKASPRNIEIFCGRLAPFGSNVQQTCYGLPIYELKLYFRTIPGVKDKIQLLVEITMENGQDLRQKQSLPAHHRSVLIVGNVRDNKLLLRHEVSDAVLIARPDMTVCVGVDLDRTDLPNNHDTIEAHLMSEMFVGLNVKKTVSYVEPDDKP